MKWHRDRDFSCYFGFFLSFYQHSASSRTSNVVSVVTRMVRDAVTDRARDFSGLQNVLCSSGAQTSCAIGTGVLCLVVKWQRHVVDQLHLVLRLRMCGYIFLLPYIPMW